jgi:hypothetical protein
MLHDIHAKFHEDWFGHSKVNEGDTHTDTRTHRQESDFISLLLFFRNKGSMLKLTVFHLVKKFSTFSQNLKDPYCAH